MPRANTAPPNLPVAAAPPAKPPDPRPPRQRNANGTFVKGFSGRQAGDPSRARKALNAETIREMHEAFRRGGRKAIDKVMLQQPAIFLKLLVLLVPRELEVTQTTGVKGMSDEAIEAAITVIEETLARRQGERAKVIESTPVSGNILPSEPDQG